MHREYGMKPEKSCSTCCNLQNGDNTKDKICIAYGTEGDAKYIGEETYIACRLYNIPFHSLRPRRAPLSEVYAPKKRIVKNDERQISMF